MSQSESTAGAPRLDTRPGPDPTDTQPQADPEEVVTVLSDGYARRILKALGEQPLCARAIAERLNASRTTVYRRLDSLESTGVVESETAVHPEGHHRKEFRVAIEGVQFSFGSEGVTVEVTA
ncbi:MAG: DNA-binding transcriptional ArsR family regulator [Haloarculaceae archaeon]|jgi:DNA-binding transcriptional ArsR family regulator